MNVAVIGGGAAGFFAAISCKTHHPHAQVTLYEKSSKLLSKVIISGGGRCNVTHACQPSQLAKFYPRGGKQLKKTFRHFHTTHTVEWFEQRGVALKTEADNRMFPVTDSSQTVVDCLMQETQTLGISVQTSCPITAIRPKTSGFTLSLRHQPDVHADYVIVATGGSPKLSGFDWLASLGHTIQPPVPSLFTFNMPEEAVTALMGVVVNPALVRIQSSKLRHDGPLLITHWGMSGPAVLKLSAWGARLLHAMDYRFQAQINWLGAMNEEQVRQQLSEVLPTIAKRKVANRNPFQLPNRFWDFILNKAGIDPDTTWNALGKKKTNVLLHTLLNDVYAIAGKTTFKEEFVTCGGVDLSEVDMNTMESKRCPGLYFAGEVLDIDGVTGGFNFQAAWTTGYVAGRLASSCQSHPMALSQRR